MKRIFEIAKSSHQDRIEAILRAAFTPYAQKAGYKLTASDYDWLPASLGGRFVYAGLEDGEIVGVVAINRRANEWVIDYVATDPDRQGEGIGSWLMVEVEKTARREGVTALILHTAEIRHDLLQFYERHGFKEVRRALPVHGKDAHLRVHMRKEI